MNDIDIRKQDRILNLVLNRPKQKNALTQSMYEIMTHALEEVRNDDNLQVAVISGTDGCFCAGNDLSEFPDNPDASGPTFVWDFLETLIRAPFPVIACMDGVSAGIGSTMLLHMDNVIASPRSRIHFSFVNMALVPEAGSSFLLPQMMGYAKAADILMRGKALSGQDAYDLGIVSTITESSAVYETAQQIARELAQKPPHALRRTKALLKGDIDALLKGIKREEEQFFAQLGSEEFSKALKAFQNKSKQ